MSQGIKNILTLLILAAVAGVGYFMFIQKDSATLSFDEYDALSGQLLGSTQAFIQHRQTLESTQLDLSIFEDPRFNSLRSFSTDVPEQETGKDDLFNEAEAVPGT